MTKGIKAALLCGAAWAVLGGAAVAQSQPAEPAAATPMQAAQQNQVLSPQDETDPVTEATQDANAATDEADVDEVVVTARRREESLQDVPIAVSAFSEQRLERQGAQDITVLQQITPNTTVQIARGSNSTLIAFIRGVGQQDPLPGFEPGVGLYIDDVYVARPQGAVLDIYDIQRIEVLRGPQGTLYGRNTIGGAIKYVTRKIGSDPTFSARTQLGNYNQRDLILSGSTPLGGGFGVSGALATFNRDGFGTNLFTGAEHYNREVLAGRLSVEYAPNQAFFARLAYERVEDDSNARHGHRERPGQGLATVGGEVIPNRYDTRAGLGDDNSVSTEMISLLAQYEINDAITVKSITARRTGETLTNIDFDGTPQPALDVPATYDDEQFTQEFQLLYEGDRLQGVLGAYYLDGTANNSFDTILGIANLTIGSVNNLKTTSFAVFGDFSFDVTEQLSFSVGGRYTRDEKTGRIFRANFTGIRSPLLGGVAVLNPSGATPATRNPRTDYTASREDEQFTPRLSASYEFSPTLTTYVSYSRGFKSGGFDPRGDAVFTPTTVEGFDPETVDAYEAGLKGSLFDRRLNFAAAIFHNDYKDQQVTSQIPAPGNAAGVQSFVDNVGNSTSNGFEIETNLRVSDSLTLTGTYGYIDAKVEEFLRFNATLGRDEDISNLVVVQNTPKHSGNVTATFTPALPSDFGELSFTPSISYRSSYSQFEFPNPILDQGAYTLVDFTARYVSPSGRYRTSLQGRNLTDEEYRVGAYNFPGPVFGNTVIGFYGPPRTFTAVFEVRF
jgi:iron complex outermembrane receptor protein